MHFSEIGVYLLQVGVIDLNQTKENNMFAHYYGSKAKGYTVTITADARPIGGKEYKVSGKREARLLAKRLNATPYNY